MRPIFKIEKVVRNTNPQEDIEDQGIDETVDLVSNEYYSSNLIT